jgi:phosphohistidine phosphatase
MTSTPRRLILLRHAKSAWGEPDLRDHDRPLNKRGRRDVPRVAAHLAGLGWEPDWVACSDARRALETWSGMAEVFGEVRLEVLRSLYLAGFMEIRDALSQAPGDATTVAIVGHNPGWEDAASRLADAHIQMTTCNACLLEGEGASWTEALDGVWRLVQLVQPKALPE